MLHRLLAISLKNIRLVGKSEFFNQPGSFQKAQTVYNQPDFSVSLRQIYLIIQNNLVYLYFDYFSFRVIKIINNCFILKPLSFQCICSICNYFSFLIIFLIYCKPYFFIIDTILTVYAYEKYIISFGFLINERRRSVLAFHSFKKLLNSRHFELFINVIKRFNKLFQDKSRLWLMQASYFEASNFTNSITFSIQCGKILTYIKLSMY